MDATHTLEAFLSKACLQTSFTIQDVYDLCRVQLSVLNRMPRKFHAHPA
jgi:hypothetical protein